MAFMNVIEAPNSLRGEEYLKNNPKARAEDLMWAFEKNVNGIIANIGGNDSIRLLPFIDINIIKSNPKIFIGYSDILNIHMMCYKAGLISFYGANLLTTLAEPRQIHSYSRYWINKTLFNNDIIGEIMPPDEYSADSHDYTNKNFMKRYHKNKGYDLICGTGIVKGRLIGGTTRLSELLGTELELPIECYDSSILFIEDIIECVSPKDMGDFIKWLNDYGILRRIKGMIISKFNEYPQNENYKIAIKNALNIEGISELPVLIGLDFGHTSPKIVLPYGVMAEIDCDNNKFSILESAVI